MTPTAPKAKSAPVVFSHPVAEDRDTAKNLRAVPVPRFESSSDSPAVPEWSHP